MNENEAKHTKIYKCIKSTAHSLHYIMVINPYIKKLKRISNQQCKYISYGTIKRTN